MAEISRSALFGRLNEASFKALESAHAYCRLRENPYVELTHWLHQILQSPDSDLHQVIASFELDRSRIQKELDTALDKLPRGSSSVMDFSSHLETTVERAFVFGALLFNEGAVRSGHLLI